ncbi:hypothetical protein [Flammeovirga aprica]|uniref:Uncharacterized protein n=1 Tax=Flammeovirga aprica JL-4 TaxID=694437 RepID=A0A7X9P0V5_9BACT|nr:hypothetical protein [Flammeovirga aprica]NME67448.1 hypothetical protein [Flammeovirga aprica JL-4]
MRKLQFIFYVLLSFLSFEIKGQDKDIKKLDAGTTISAREESLEGFHINVPQFPISETNLNYKSDSIIYYNNCVGEDSVTLYGRINPFLFIVAFGDAYGVLSLNEKSEIMDIDQISLFSSPDNDGLYTKIINDTTLKVTYLDGYRKRVENYTLVQRDGILVKKDSSFTKPKATFDEWEDFYIHYDRNKD